MHKETINYKCKLGRKAIDIIVSVNLPNIIMMSGLSVANSVTSCKQLTGDPQTHRVRPRPRQQGGGQQMKTTTMTTTMTFIIMMAMMMIITAIMMVILTVNS